MFEGLILVCLVTATNPIDTECTQENAIVYATTKMPYPDQKQCLEDAGRFLFETIKPALDQKYPKDTEFNVDLWCEEKE